MNKQSKTSRTPQITDGTGRFIEALEPRVLLAADPVLTAIPDVTLLSGSPLVIALNGTDPEGTALTFTAVSSDPGLVTTDNFVGNRSLRITVADFGVMVFELFENIASRATDRFIELATDTFFDGIIFHRVIDGFVIQGGDPTGTGTGGSTLGDFDDQFDVRLQHNQGGLLSMAKSTDDTNDSQFFVTEVATRSLDFNHTIFGILTTGEDVREAISNTPTGAGDKPLTDVVMDSVVVFVDPDNGVLLLSAPEGAVGETDITVTVTDGEGNTDTQMFHVTVTPDTFDGGPFLEDIPEIRVTEGDVAGFTLSGIDPEDDAMFFAAAVSSGTFDFTIDSATGAATVTPTDGFTGELGFLAGVRAPDGMPSDTGGGFDFDTQVVPIFVDALEAISPISDFGVGEDVPDTLIDLDAVFTDPGAGGPFTFIVEANTNGALVTTSITGGMLTLGYVADGNGTADITVRATNGGGVFAQDTFTVTVAPGNDAPTIEDQTFDAVAGNPVGTLLGTVDASDIDAADVLTFAITAGNEAGALAIDAMTGDLTIADAAAFAAGVTFTLTVQVTDTGALTDTATITALVTRIALVTPITDVPVDEDAPDTVIDLSSVFTDPGMGDSYTFTIDSNTNDTLVTTTIVGDMLTLAFQPNGSGTADISLRATNTGGEFGLDAFTVTVASVDDTPVVEDQAFNAVAGSMIGTELGTVLATDGDPGDVLTFAITAGDPTFALTINASTGQLFIADAVAFASEMSIPITVEVTDSDGLTDTAAVTVTVDPIEVIAPIADFIVDEDAADTIIDLTPVFTDLGDAGPFIFNIEINTNPALITATITDNLLTLDFLDDANGTADITVRATSGGVAVTDDIFTVTVDPVNDAPTIEDQATGVAAGSPADAVVGSVEASDVDAGDTLTFAITAGNDAGALAIDAATGQITVADEAAFDAAAGFSLTVTATDTGALTSAATMTIALVSPDGISALGDAGDGTPDEFEVSLDGTEVVVVLNDDEIFRDTLASLTSLTINGSTDDDTLTVSFADGDPVPSGGILYTGGGPGDNDTLTIEGGMAGVVTHTFTAVDSGSVDIDGSLITYAGLEPIFDNLDATDRVFDFGDGADDITIRDDATPDDGISEIVSVASGETVAFMNPTGSLTVNAGGGDDDLTVEPLDGTVAFDVTIDTGAGNDNVDTTTADFVVQLEDGGGMDTIESGAGGVVRRINGTAGKDKISITQKGDELKITINRETQTVILGDGDISLEVFALDGDDRITLSQLTVTTRVDGGAGNDRITASKVRDANVTLVGGDGDDRLTGGDGNDILDGGDGNDKIRGDDGNDQIFGGDGDDKLSGDNDNDTIFGGAGKDKINGGDGNDFADGGDGDDKIIGGNGSDTLDGGDGDDKIIGGDGNDDIDGEDGNDKLIGGDGNDSLDGGDGDDKLNAGKGRDFLIGGPGFDRINGQGDTDTVSYESSTSGVNVSLQRGKTDDDGFGDSDPSVKGIENVDGSNFDDFIDGNKGRNVLDGLDGTDVLRGRGGSGDLLLNSGPTGDSVMAAGDLSVEAGDAATELEALPGEPVDALDTLDADASLIDAPEAS